MATYASKPVPVKQLKEHLQEQQEPFTLSTYLSERRYSMKKLSSDGENNSGSGNFMTNLKGPCSSSLRKRGILHAPRNLKSLLYKFISPSDRQVLPSCNKSVKEKLVSETIDMIQQIAETNWFSTVSNVTPCSASEESNYGASEHSSSFRQSEEERLRGREITHKADRLPQIWYYQPWSCKEDDKQLSSVTGLQDLTSGPSTSSLFLTLAEEPLFSAFLLKSRVKSLTLKQIQVSFREVKEAVHTGSFKYLRKKRVLPLQSKRLSLDCINRAIIHNVRNNERQKNLHNLLSLQELGKIISGQLCSLGKQLVNASNAAHLPNLDFSSTPEEWNHFQQTKVHICREMGDSIIDGIIDETIELQ